MAARIKDVARRVGVSSATVSRVLSNKPDVSEEVRRRILAAMEELDYQLSRRRTQFARSTLPNL